MNFFAPLLIVGGGAASILACFAGPVGEFLYGAFRDGKSIDLAPLAHRELYVRNLYRRGMKGSLMRYSLILLVIVAAMAGCAATEDKGPSTLREWGELQKPKL